MWNAVSWHDIKSGTIAYANKFFKKKSASVHVIVCDNEKKTPPIKWMMRAYQI